MNFLARSPRVATVSISLGLTGLLLSLATFAINGADASSYSSPSPSPSPSSSSYSSQVITSSVATVPLCAYSMAGVQTPLSLNASKVYNPDSSDLTTLTGSDSGVLLGAYPGGDSSQACSFYGNASGGRISVSIPDTAKWSGTSGGTTFTWDVNSSSRGLGINPSKKTDCNSAGVNPPNILLYTSSNKSSDLITISSSGSPKQCTVDASFSTSIPSGLNAPGGFQTYTMSGPTLTYTLITS